MAPPAKNPRIGIPRAAKSTQSPTATSSAGRTAGGQGASERADQIAPDESGDQSIETRNKKECERENHHPNRARHHAGMVIEGRRRRCRSTLF